MKTARVDPRDGTWEQDEASYLVYFWDGAEVASHEYEVTEAGIDEALAWARERAAEEGWTYTFYVKVPEGEKFGLVRIEGVRGDPFARG